MPFDSLVRTKQINKPEFSGYIVDVLLQYLKTGSITGIAMNTGQLSGQFYPLQSNPSGYITTGSLSGYATQQYVTNADTAVLSYVGGTYYPSANPSGFVTSGQLTGLAQVTGDIIIAGTGGIAVTGVNGIIYISGDGTANNLTGYVPWTYFLSGWSQTLPYISLADSYLPGKFIFANVSHEFLMEGYRTGYPSEKFFIDFYGLSASRYGLTYTRPTIFGFDISGAFISSSGYPVLTTKDLTGLASWNQLLITSGQLEDDIWRVRTEVFDLLTGTGGYTMLNVDGHVYSGVVTLTGIGGMSVRTGGAHTIFFSGGGASFSTGGFVDLGSYQTIVGSKNFSGSTRFQAIRPPAGKSIIDMSTKRMQFEDVDVLDWTGQWLISPDSLRKTLDWRQRLAFDSSEVITIDWEHRKLSGNWNVGTGVVYVTGNQIITGQKTFQSITISGYPVMVSSGQTFNTGDFEPKLLGAPTDGTYGGPNGAIAGIQVGDTHPDAFDKIEVVLGKLAPTKPANLSQSVFILTGSLYSAFMQGTATQYTGVQATQRPTGYATGFYDGDYGVLSGFINTFITGSKVLSTGIDTGNYTGLVIYADFDYWSGVAGKAGFWRALSAKVSPTGWLQSGMFTMQMKHSTAGDSPIITGYCDVPTPAASLTLTNTAWVTGVCTLRYIDGVPGLAANDPVKASFTGGGAVTAFYSNPVARLTSAQLATSNILATLNPTSGQSMALSGTGLAGASTYSTGIVITGTLYNSISGSNTTTFATNIRIDTMSTQQTGRKTAGSGQWPAGGYGTGYDNNTVFSGNEELQMIAGVIQYPPKVNYGSFLPFGPNYANIPSGTNSGYRWAFFDCGSLSNVSNIQVTFNGTSNFGAATIIPGFQLFAKVSGVIGWVDGNAPYPGVGNPATDGAPALVVGSSSATVKLITFGTATLSGPVYIRVGLPSGSTKSFTTVSFQTA